MFNWIYVAFYQLSYCLILSLDLSADDVFMSAYVVFAFKEQKPESWRLACQTIVGNKENAGKVKKG